MHRRSVLAAAAALGGGCVGDSPDADTNPTGGTVSPAATSDTAYPHLRPTGNRVTAASGTVDTADPVDVPLDGAPTWLVALPTDAGSEWAVVDDSDTLSRISLRGRDAMRSAVGPWPATRPPVLSRRGGDIAAVDPPAGASPLAPPYVTGGRTVAAAEDGDVLIVDTTGEHRLDASLLPDARCCRLDVDRVVALGGATDRYAHGALGDGIEAGAVVVVNHRDRTVERRIEVPDGRVVEGTAPIVADFGGRRAIVVTESDADAGARIAAYAPDGTRIAVSDPVGTGFRWRHQLAVAPFGPGGRSELAVVRTPHIGGTVEFFDAALDRVATVDGASSHAYQSRNLDGGLAADADGDGRTELLVPGDARERVRAVERHGTGAGVEWTRPVGGRISSNLHAVGHGGGLAVGIGRRDGTVRLWIG